MLKILIAPDSFKGSLTSLQAAAAIEAGVKRVLPRALCFKVPLADGGEGTVQALVDALGGTFHYKQVTGPAGKAVRARYGLLADNETTVLEVAATSGLYLVDSKHRNPMNATSYGAGELIVAAAERGAKRIIIGIGGSATVDAGMGMAQAIGVRFSDSNGRVIQQPGCGRLLERVAGIDLSAVPEILRKIRIQVACDVENPLYGEAGAATVYGPQKGATPAMVRRLDSGLKQFSSVVSKELDLDKANAKGAGAAGGLGYGLTVFTRARISGGLNLIAGMTGLKEKIAAADLVITGEGRIDAQTAFGKAPAGVAKLGKRLKVPVIAIGGSLGDGSQALFQQDIQGLEAAVTESVPLKMVLQHAEKNLTDAAERALRLILVGNRLAEI